MFRAFEHIFKAFEHRFKVYERSFLLGLETIINRNNINYSLELKEIDSDQEAPIRSVGQHSHKVWVRRKKDKA